MKEIKRARKRISAGLKEDLKFIKGWVKSPSAVGSIKPTGRVASRHMAGLLPIDTGLPILELGPGTGVFTREMLRLGVPPEKIVSVEYSLEFYEFLKNKFPGVQFVHGDAFDLDAALESIPYESYAGVVSGIPLLNFSNAERTKLLEGALERVAGDGPFLQICYGPNPPVKSVPGKFIAVKSDRVLRNIPPVAIWIYRKDIR